MRRNAFVVASVLSVTLIGLALTTTATATPNPPGPSSRALSAINSGALAVHRDAAGTVDYVSARAGHPLAAPSGMSARTLSSAASVARANVTDFAGVFGIANPDRNLRQLSSVASGKGSAVRFQQTDNGLPVIGAQLVVSQDASGALEAINGRAGDTAGANLTPSISTARATSAALTATAEAAKVSRSGLAASKPQLSVYDPALLHATNVLGARTVYQVAVTDTANPAVNQYVLVDAATGGIDLTFSQNGAAFAPGLTGAAKAAKTATVAAVSAATPAQKIEICDFAEKVAADPTCKKPVSNAGSSAITDVKDANNFLTGIDNFYNTEVGRKGIDNNEMPVLGSVRYCPDSEDCPFENSYWNNLQVVFGQGFPQAPDVVGHEYTHGVTQYTSGLMYYYQSGAINESMSDTMGELYDFSNATDNPSGQWLFGEDLPSATFERNMSDPTQSGQGPQPDSMSSQYWGSDGYDSGGVHTDSGVGNKAAYLAAEGGTFNSVTITGITADSSTTAILVQKMAEIWYTADTLMTSGADYADFGNALTQACTNLGTTAGITTADCAAVSGAVAATQMESTTSSHLPPQAYECGSGYTPVTSFSDNFNRTGTTIGNGWTQTGSPTLAEAASPSQGVTGNQAYIPEPYPDTSPVGRYAYTPSVKLSSSHTNYLYFQHLDSDDWFVGADGQPPTTNLYMEGMFIDYQTSGSSTWHTLSSSTWINGPTKTVYHTKLTSDQLTYSTPYSGKAFAGDSKGWESSRATLPTSIKGKSVKFRFKLQTDGFDWFTSSYGELLDNVTVNDCVKAPLMPTNVAVKGYYTSATMSWTQSSTNGGDAISAYAVYVEKAGTTTNTRTTLSASTTSFTWTGLLSGVNYRFEIRAENIDGVYSSPYVVVNMVGSNLTLVPSATSVAPSTPVTLTGTLTNTSNAALNGRSVVLYQRPHGTTTWTAVSPSTTTDASGNFSILVTPTASEDYSVHYSTGSPTTLGTVSPTITVTVTP